MPKIRPIPSNTVEPDPVRVKPGQADKVPPEYAVEIDLEEEFPQDAQAASETGQDRGEAEAGREESQESGEGEEREPQALSRQAEEVRQAEENRQRQAAEAERARQAEAQRRAHEQQLAYERRQREQAEHDSLVNAIAAANSDLESARAAVLAARQAGDVAAETDAFDRMSEARYRITMLSGGKDAQEERLQEPEPPPPPQQYQEPQRQPTANDVINSMTGLMPEERSWLMKHPDLVMSQQGQRRLEVAYYDATDAGLTRGSPEYFQFFNERLGFNDEDNSMPANNQKPARANGAGRQVAAPVSRSGTDVKTGREQVSGSKVTLNPQQREAAKYSGISEEEYAKQLRKLMELKKSGHYQES